MAPDRPLPSPMASSRLAWVDVARGIGIILVVYGHALRAMYPHGGMPPAVAWQDRAIYAFHMPLFFLLTGLFLWPSIAKKGNRFVADRLVTVAYPYFLWSLITALIELAASPWVNSPLTLTDLLYIPVRPIEQYWFLFVLFWAQLIAFCFFPRKVLLVVLAVAGLALSRVGALGILDRVLFFLPFVVGGILLPMPLQRLADGGTPVRVLVQLCSVACFASLVLALAAFPGSLPVELGCALAGIAMTLTFAMLICARRGGLALASLGRASLAIYVMHTIFSAGARIGMSATGAPIPPVVMIALTTGAGILLPYLVWRAARRAGVTVPLGFGQ